MDGDFLGAFQFSWTPQEHGVETIVASLNVLGVVTASSPTTEVSSSDATIQPGDSQQNSDSNKSTITVDSYHFQPSVNTH